MAAYVFVQFSACNQQSDHYVPLSDDDPYIQLAAVLGYWFGSFGCWLLSRPRATSEAEEEEEEERNGHSLVYE